MLTGGKRKDGIMSWIGACRWTSSALAAGAMVAVGACTSAAPAACQYQVTIIERPSCGIFGDANMTPTAINDLGHVAGYINCIGIDNRAFVWTPETGVVVLETPAGFATARAHDISNNGDVVGEARTDTPGEAVLWRDGEVIQLGIPPGGIFSVALAINDAGIIAGQWGNHVTGEPSKQGFLWEDGRILDLAPIMAPEASSAEGISEATDVVGWMGSGLAIDAHAFLLSDGVVTDLGVVPGGYTGHAVDINRHRQVVGWGHVKNPGRGEPPLWRSFIWSKGEMQELGVVPGYVQRTIALALNEVGQAVGYAVPDSSSPSTAFLWQEGRLWDLNDLLVSYDGHTSRAVDVNELGQIAATGPVILTPIDRPLTDLNIDCRTDSRDLIILLEQWGDTESPADFDGDGIVGLGDLLLLLTHWG